MNVNRSLEDNQVATPETPNAHSFLGSERHYLRKRSQVFSRQVRATISSVWMPKMDLPSGTSMAWPFSPGCSRQRILAPGFSELGLLFLTAEEFHRASPHSTLCFYRRIALILVDVPFHLTRPSPSRGRTRTRERYRWHMIR
jgi:hypothetical protein